MAEAATMIGGALIVLMLAAWPWAQRQSSRGWQDLQDRARAELKRGEGACDCGDLFDAAGRVTPDRLRREGGAG